MKYAFWLMTVCVPTLLLAQTNARQTEYRNRLIGTWKFLETYDRNDKKVDTIWHPAFDLGGVRAWEIPDGPLTKYFHDGTYSKQFTDTNVSKGTWNFDYNEQAIILHSYFTKPYDWAAKDLIKRGYATKDKRGAYFEVLTDRVVDLTDNRLIIMERDGRKEIYQKID